MNDAVILVEPDAVSIPHDVATLCADCGAVHNRPRGTCPSCTSRHGILLARLLAVRQKPELRAVRS